MTSQGSAPSASADGWTSCDLGHRHWGRAGAAGVLVMSTVDGVTRYLLQHRAAEVHHGLTWGIPGGALAYGEDPLSGARREAQEEIGGLPHDLTVLREMVDDHGGWSYTTLVMSSPHRFSATSHQWENGPDGVHWWTADEIADLPLHPGFAASWATVRAQITRR